MKNPEDFHFLKEKYSSKEEFREATQKAAQRTEIREEKKIPNEPEALIENYLKK